jgi:hypothetical protein
MPAKESRARAVSASDARERTSQKDLPKVTLEEALKVPRAVFENYGGKPTAPHNVAIALDVSPGSSKWRTLTGAAVGYGLVDGAYGSDQIGPTPLSRRLFAPTVEGEELRAKREAALAPTVFRRFYEKYDGAKFPRDDIAVNVLKEMGVPDGQAQEALQNIKSNGQFAEVLVTTKTGLFVFKNGRAPMTSVLQGDPALLDGDEAGSVETPSVVDPAAQARSGSADAKVIELSSAGARPSSQWSGKVFITHGKNLDIVRQL